MKTVKVVAAIIRKDNYVFATERGYGAFQGGWEFPGGKVEPGETPEQALEREILEELDTQITVEDFFCSVEYDYPTFHLSMDCYLCKVKAGELQLKEHAASRWLTKETLYEVDWLPADVEIIKKLGKIL